ncbi:MAG TPA: GAF domain-containing protein, partial [Chloroflexi bacterium]|nr:GAF domain-containing protein [Chloroflexota bacterium]
PEAFTEADIRFLQTVTQQATTALEGLRLFEQTQIRARRLQATNEVTRTASSILNIDILLPLVVQQISDAFGYYHVQIFLLDEAGEWAVLKASTGEVGQELLRRGHKLAVGSQSVIGQVTARGEPVIAHDTDTDPVHRRNELLPDTRAEMALPLRTGDRVIGALDVQSVQPNAFDPEAQAILRSLADQIAVTLENVQLFQEIQERVAELTTINLVAQSVSRADTLEELYDVVTAQLMRTFGARHGYLGLIDRSNIIHLPIFIEGGERIESPEPFPLGEGLTSHVLQSKKVLLINENAMEKAEQMGAKLVGAVPKSLLIVPLMLGNEAIGVISIQDMEKENAFTEAHIRQLSTLAAYIAVKIRNAELLEEAQRRADELGFLFNVTRAAVSSTELDEALSNVVEIVQDEIGGVESAIIYLANIEASVLEPYAAVGYGREVIARQEPVPWGKGLVGTVAARGEPLIIHDTIQHEEAASAEGRTRSAVLVPLQAGGQFSGVLAIESTRPNAFGERELRLLEAASGTLNAVIQNARLLEEVTRANEQLRELDQLKSQFLANMSHELRTPLNSIIGFSRVMLKGIDGPLNDLQTQDLTTIHQSGQHLLGLINNILDMSKIEAGKMEIQPEYVNLEDIVDTVIATGRGLVKDKPIQIFKEVEPGLPMVYGDPVRLRQILLNLVSNAAKFTHEGSITVRVERKDYDPLTGEPPRVQVDVSDTGIGIAKEDMDKLFEAFRQVDGSTTRQVGGTGLGLAISREFVEMHGGRMWVESEPGVGSTFSFTIPLHPPEDTDAEVYASPAYDDGRPIVLAVDDEPGVLDLYRRYLEKEGYAFVALKNANDLLHHVRRVRPSAILLDLNLPGRDGWQAIDDLRTAEDTDDIPIVICSIEDQRQRAEEVGAAGYLTKPIIEDDLLGVLRDVLAEYPTGQTDEQEEPERQTILIVSGQPEYRRVLQEALSNELDCTIQIALTGYESLQILQDGLPSVMLLDADLPDMDGYGLLLALRSQEEFQTLPVILLTKRALSSEELAALGNTCTRYLVKAPRGDGQPISALLDLLAELSA